MVELKRSKKENLPEELAGMHGPDLFIATGLPDDETDFDQTMMQFTQAHHKEEHGFMIAKALCKPALIEAVKDYNDKIVYHLTTLVSEKDGSDVEVYRYKCGYGAADFIGIL